MNLENVAVNIRPRNQWEAIDIGFQVARKWYLQLLQLWLLSAFPYILFILGASYFLPGRSVIWAFTLFWLSKPLFEPAMLGWISQALFGEKKRGRETLKKMKGEITFRSFLSILLLRLSFFRSFMLPIILLEKPKGKERRLRASLLKQNAEICIVLSLAGFCIELALAFSLIIVLFWLIPEELRLMTLKNYVISPDNWILFLSYIVANALFAPFFVASGFMLYISRRVTLEAWDLEIGFKRMRQRIKNRRNGVARVMSILMICSFLSLNSLPQWSNASTIDPEGAKESITKVLAEDEFGKTVTKTRWEPKKKEKKEKESKFLKFLEEIFEKLFEKLDNIDPSLPHLLATMLKVAIFLLVGVSLGYILIRYTRLRGLLDSYFSPPSNGYVPPDIMFGMDLRPESLPDDIGTVCTQLLDEGKKREALSLLYRGTLSNLINIEKLEIHSSFTENECCHEVSRSRPGKEAKFFDELTSIWVTLAYGHRQPEDTTCQGLVQQWGLLYGGHVS